MTRVFTTTSIYRLIQTRITVFLVRFFSDKTPVIRANDNNNVRHTLHSTIFRAFHKTNETCGYNTDLNYVILDRRRFRSEIIFTVSFRNVNRTAVNDAMLWGNTKAYKNCRVCIRRMSRWPEIYDLCVPSP